MANIEKMLHKILVNKNDHDALKFNWRNSAKEQFQDIQMNVHIFGKTDSPCCCIWGRNKTSSDDVIKIIDCK